MTCCSSTPVTWAIVVEVGKGGVRTVDVRRGRGKGQRRRMSTCLGHSNLHNEGDSLIQYPAPGGEGKVRHANKNSRRPHPKCHLEVG